ncbi:MAG: hypothetical protein PUI19_09870, partial [Sodaliphilus pleomorphus]|nr:hypothetical protein [Sodaliphilus pleomorphus]
MKKSLLLAAMTVLGFGLAHADFSQGAGHFYMIQNKATKRYINLIHDQGNALSQDFHAIRLENDGEQHTEPGTIIYISSEKILFSTVYNLSAQGTSVKEITGFSVNINKNGTGDNGEAVYNADVLSAVYFQDEAGFDKAKPSNSNADDVKWYIKPVDTGGGGDCYFGVSPKATDYLDGYYYTTLRASFAYKLSQGVDAFTVVGGKLHELPHDNVVPANTPVILRCKSTLASDNRLYPQAIGGKYTAESTVTSSLVSGTKYSYFKTSVVNAKVGETGSYTNGKPYGLGTAKSDANANYRVLSVKDGQLGFFDTFASAYPNDLCINGELAYMDTKSDVVLIAKPQYTTTTLSDLARKGLTGTDYKVNGNGLKAVVRFQTQGGDRYIVVTDGDKAVNNYVTDVNQGNDYAIDGHNQRTYTQNNWLLVKVNTDEQWKLDGQNITSITGRYVDASNPTLEATAIEAPSTLDAIATYTPNVYCPVNFTTTAESPLVQGKYGSGTRSYFFMTPKRNEWAHIVYAVPNKAGTAFTVPESRAGINGHNFAGEVSVSWDYNADGDVSDVLSTSDAYVFDAIVKENVPVISAPARVAAQSRYTIFPLNINRNNPVTAVSSVSEAATV